MHVINVFRMCMTSLFPSKEPSVVIVVTLLKAIMKDEVSEVKIVFTIIWSARLICHITI